MVHLVDEADGLTPDAPILLLEDELRSVADIGRTIATKLMARKRPRLVPIYDTVVGHVHEYGCVAYAVEVAPPGFVRTVLCRSVRADAAVGQCPWLACSIVWSHGLTEHINGFVRSSTTV